MNPSVSGQSRGLGCLPCSLDEILTLAYLLALSAGYLEMTETVVGKDTP